MADATVLNTVGLCPCGFESRLRHLGDLQGCQLSRCLTGDGSLEGLLDTIRGTEVATDGKDVGCLRDQIRIDP